MQNEEQPVISIQNLSKIFRLPHEKHNTLKATLIHFWDRNRGYEKQSALKNVTFEVNAGEFFGIVGRNGSGKSTLLKILAGIYEPNKGRVSVRGKLTPFIELGVGFNPELTGRENVFLNGALLGFSRKQMQLMYQEIVDFAEIERFMDQKLKNYSSGMQVRLAFSIAIRAKSDILLIDEVLAVGDAIFQKKCYDYFNELKKQKKTVIFVSHDSESLLEYCERGLLLDKGTVITIDRIDRVVNGYFDILNSEEDGQQAKEDRTKNRWGSGSVRIEETVTCHSSGHIKTLFTDEDETLVIRVKQKARENIDRPVYGIIITDDSDHRVFVTNTLMTNTKTSDLKKDQEVTVEWRVPNVFNSGTFSIAPAVALGDGSTILDWIEGAGRFRVRKKIKTAGFINVKHDIIIS